MTAIVRAETLTDGWLADLEHLFAFGAQFNLLTTIGRPDPQFADDRIVQELNRWPLGKGRQRVETVANTIFPVAYLRGGSDRQQLYDRYLSLLPRLRMQKGNGRGTYFGRLIQYPTTAGVQGGEHINQIEAIIEKLQKELNGRRPKRFSYQAQVYAPGYDDKVTMGFPCLSFVSFQLNDRRLNMTAMYRNQYYFERVLGNFLGLAHLLRFVAEASHLEAGTLAIHACHAEIDELSNRDVGKLIRACREVSPVEEAA